MSQLESENDLLRNELKNLANLTKTKILDLENNINGIHMLKENEVENFDMEKQKLQNNRDFLGEQMKAQFTERSQKLEQMVSTIQTEKEQIAIQVKAVQEELRNFKFAADNKIQSTLSEIVTKEQQEHSKQLAEAESQLDSIEEELRGIQSKIQDQIQRYQVNINRQWKETTKDK